MLRAGSSREASIKVDDWPLGPEENAVPFYELTHQQKLLMLSSKQPQKQLPTSIRPIPKSLQVRPQQTQSHEPKISQRPSSSPLLTNFLASQISRPFVGNPPSQQANSSALLTEETLPNPLLVGQLHQALLLLHSQQQQLTEVLQRFSPLSIPYMQQQQPDSQMAFQNTPVLSSPVVPSYQSQQRSHTVPSLSLSPSPFQAQLKQQQFQFQSLQLLQQQQHNARLSQNSNSGAESFQIQNGSRYLEQHYRDTLARESQLFVSSLVNEFFFSFLYQFVIYLPDVISSNSRSVITCQVT
jgi:hypothetical protein